MNTYQTPQETTHVPKHGNANTNVYTGPFYVKNRDGEKKDRYYDNDAMYQEVIDSQSYSTQQTINMLLKEKMILEKRLVIINFNLDSLQRSQEPSVESLDSIKE